ncbi:hypothetical protein GCM10007067_28210 [Lysobacter bugurensis]|uniref:Uncharacterized protein n=1 Tax=Cognatilysobacter bugurensis TaxID=543356 RepID=A0A918T2R2_9GAMM|nr:hypothetical protein GCM10007067_28210 [Lysobacter bugurensis]
MAQVLKLPQLVKQDRMTEMQIRGGRIEAGLDAQRTAELQTRFELLALENFIGTPRN